MLCTHCFREMHTDGPCPHCGFDGREQESRYPLALRPGSILNGRYTVGRVLGQGGFGITYIALDDRTGSRVAIKEYLPTEFAGRAGGSSMVQVYSGERRDNFAYGMERFLDEARTLAEFIGDAHIVRIYSYFEENATAYFVMEYVDGTPLNKYMESVGGRLSVEDAAALLLPLMDSLGHVHAKGVVHRDIAPDNVLIEHGRSAKIIDFGAARYSTGEKSKSLDVILKHGFAPMEQYTRRGRQGPFTDVYAMAATFYFAITAKVPPEPIDRLYDDPLAAPSALGVKISDAAEAVFFKALEVPAQQRYQSMAEFHRDMDAALTADRLGREQREREARREQERLDREQKDREHRAEAERLQQEQRAEAERLRQEQKAEAERLRREEKERAAREKAERKTRAQAERAARKTAAARTASEPPAPQHKKKTGLPLILGAAALVIAALVFVFARGGRPASPALPEPSAAAGAEASVSEAVSAAEEATEEAAAAVSGPYRPGAELLLAGTDLHGPCEVDDWTDVVKVFSAGGFTLGVRRDGTALATGANMYGECNLAGWDDIAEISAAGYITAARRDLPGSETDEAVDDPADTLTISATSGDDMYDLLKDTFLQSGGTLVADDGRLLVIHMDREYVFCMAGLDLRDSYTVNKEGMQNTLEYGWRVNFDNGRQRFEVTTVSWRFHPGQPEQRTLDEMDHALYRADGMAEGTRFEYVLTPGSVSMSHTDSCIFWIFTLPESVDFDMANVRSFTCTVNADDESESWTTPAIGH